ncbi:uncharacterized protein [Blastocystis hominis]|uniref:BRCT domain-containing protein n=1 Tax=Blastocystis hominis TaxID=12968 RepID=D8LVT5_BLAHO|nr:uncharacterized protein [Blastocystis hominis]CBK19924.2 unnamed protein product [Blastocystis hominis]|eukprot:XP_012893972.1 uncharacterized protein [Blastocystis hominis]
MWTRGDYFAHKNKRIVEQTSFEGEKKSSIFEGVCAYIDGSTETSYLVLRQMICNHGGSFVPAMYGAKITHYIAENPVAEKPIHCKTGMDNRKCLFGEEIKRIII